jgi:hypothetical protein
MKPMPGLPPRVYYTPGPRAAARVGLLALAVLLWIAPAGAQDPKFTLAPAMTRGAAGAPVTIVEFSDYQ